MSAEIDEKIMDANSRSRWRHFYHDPAGVLISFCGDIPEEHAKKFRSYIKENGNEVQIDNVGFRRWQWFAYSLGDELLFFNNRLGGYYVQKTHWDNVEITDDGKIHFKGVDKYGMGQVPEV